MAEPYPPTKNVAVVNDHVHHERGDQISSTLSRRGHDAYLYGGTQQFKVLAAWAGVVLCILGAGLGIFRAGRGWLVLAGGTVLWGALLLGTAGSIS